MVDAALKDFPPVVENLVLDAVVPLLLRREAAFAVLGRESGVAYDSDGVAPLGDRV